MKIGAIIQTRVSSTRLPGKVLKELPYGSGITVLEQVIRRLKKAKKISEIIVATTVEKKDKPVVNIAKKEKVNYFRGSKINVLSRYYLCARENNIDIIVRICSDSPCIDPGLVDMVIGKHIKTKADFCIMERTIPHGLDVETINFDVLKEASKKAKKDYEKEHVTPYIYKNPSIFKITQVEVPKRLSAPDVRLTLDTEEDYALLCAVFDCLYFKNRYFSAYDIINLFKERPWLKLINKKIIQKKIFNTLEDELKEASNLLDLQELGRARAFLKAHS